MASSIYKGSDEIDCPQCDVCKNLGDTATAVSHCPTCSEFLCKACDRAHRGSKQTKNHKLGPISAGSFVTTSTSAAIYCGEHVTIVIDLYCQTHDEVICSACQITSHRKCEILKVSQLKTHSLDFETRIKSLERLRTAYETMKMKINMNKQALSSEVDTCLNEMHHIRDQINKALDEIENTLKKEMSQVKQMCTTETDSQMAVLDNALTQIAVQLEKLNKTKNMKKEEKFVAMKISSNTQRKLEETLNNIEKGISHNEPKLKLNGNMYDAFGYLQSTNTVPMTAETHGYATDGGAKRTQTTSRKSILDFSLSDRRAVNTGLRIVYRCTFTPDGFLVISGTYNDKLLVLDKEFNMQSELEIRAYGVAAISDREVLVTQGPDKQIQKVKVVPKMKVINTIETDRECWGIDVAGGEIFVGCYGGGVGGEVQVLDMNGKVLRRLGASNGEYMFKSPDYIKVSKDGGKIFISDVSAKNVTCLDRQGHVIFRYSDSVLVSPKGMHLDGEGNLLVCGFTSNNVHVVGPDGGKRKVLLSGTDGLYRPYCISYRESDGCLVIGIEDCRNKKSLLCFTAK